MIVERSLFRVEGEAGANERVVLWTGQ